MCFVAVLSSLLCCVDGRSGHWTYPAARKSCSSATQESVCTVWERVCVCEEYVLTRSCVSRQTQPTEPAPDLSSPSAAHLMKAQTVHLYALFVVIYFLLIHNILSLSVWALFWSSVWIILCVSAPLVYCGTAFVHFNVAYSHVYAGSSATGKLHCTDREEGGREKETYW